MLEREPRRGCARLSGGQAHWRSWRVAPPGELAWSAKIFQQHVGCGQGGTGFIEAGELGGTVSGWFDL